MVHVAANSLQPNRSMQPSPSQSNYTINYNVRIKIFFRA